MEDQDKEVKNEEHDEQIDAVRCKRGGSIRGRDAMLDENKPSNAKFQENHDNQASKSNVQVRCVRYQCREQSASNAAISTQKTCVEDTPCRLCSGAEKTCGLGGALIFTSKAYLSLPRAHSSKQGERVCRKIVREGAKKAAKKEDASWMVESQELAARLP